MVVLLSLKMDNQFFQVALNVGFKAVVVGLVHCAASGQVLEHDNVGLFEGVQKEWVGRVDGASAVHCNQDLAVVEDVVAAAMLSEGWNQALHNIAPPAGRV